MRLKSSRNLVAVSMGVVKPCVWSEIGSPWRHAIEVVSHLSCGREQTHQGVRIESERRCTWRTRRTRWAGRSNITWRCTWNGSKEKKEYLESMRHSPRGPRWPGLPKLPWAPAKRSKYCLYLIVSSENLPSSPGVPIYVWCNKWRETKQWGILLDSSLSYVSCWTLVARSSWFTGKAEWTSRNFRNQHACDCCSVIAHCLPATSTTTIAFLAHRAGQTSRSSKARQTNDTIDTLIEISHLAEYYYSEQSHLPSGQ